MPTQASSARFVLDFLRAHAVAVTPHTIRVTTGPGDGRQFITLIRAARPAEHPWSDGYALRLANDLKGLPGADVVLHPVRDRIVVTWDGA